jgi:peptidoglycan/LPS O-acetylase OafA/YrhL
MWRKLAADVYGVYVFHFPVVMAVQWALIGAPVAVWVRLVATVALAVVISFMLVDQLILRLPGMRRIF